MNDQENIKKEANGIATCGMTIPIAVYTGLILLVISSKPARNM